MFEILITVLVVIVACVGILIKRHGLTGGFSAAKQFVVSEWGKLFKSSTLWLSYALMAWPQAVGALDQDHKWLDFLPAAWHDKSIAYLGGLVLLARMRSVLPPKPAPPAQQQ